jgi:signal transduction histidine kinase
MRQLDIRADKQLGDYCHYFRGVGFRKKRLFNNAEKEFNRISGSFRYSYMVQLQLGEIALEESHFREALMYYQDLEKSIAHSPVVRQSSFYHNTGLCYFHLQRYDSAAYYLTKAMDVRLKERDSSGLIASYMDLGNLYYEQYLDEQAIGFFRKAYELSKQTGGSEVKQNAALNMAVVEENRKHFPEALAYRKEFESWRDSLTDQNKIWAIADLEKKFAVQQKQKQVDILRTRNALKVAERNTYLTASVLLALLLGVGIYFYRQKVMRSKIILAQKTELDELNATKDKLFSIVSHDLRSSVHALQVSNDLLNDSPEIAGNEQLALRLRQNTAIANSTYGLLDNLLHWALLQTGQSYFHQEQLPLFRIAEQAVYNYKALMTARNIRFKNSIPKNMVVYADAESLKIILRNLIDNSIKFSQENGRISLSALPPQNGYCTLVVEDSGLGMTESSRLSLLKETVLLSRKKHEDTLGTGLGLQLCKSMIRKNGGRFGIESRENHGTKMFVSLPQKPADG